MAFVKFHYMRQEKKFLMSPLNSNKLFFFSTNFHFTSQNNITITVHKCSALFSFLFQSYFFNLYTVYFSKKCSLFSFFFFFSLCCVQQCSSVFSLPLCLFPLSCTSLFFSFLLFFSFFLIINCSFTILFFKPCLCLSLSLP